MSDDRTKLDNLNAVLVEDILAECEEDGIDAEAIAEQMRADFDKWLAGIIAERFGSGGEG